MVRIVEGSTGRWASSDVEVCTGCLKRGTAMVQAMLPMAAVIVGMAAFGLIVHFVA